LQKLKRGFLGVRGLVLNYEALRQAETQKYLLDIVSERKTFLCVDESQRVKNSRSKSFLALQSIANFCQRRVLLSGTPTPKDITDIWSQMLLIDRGERFGTSFYRWLETVAELGSEYSDYAVKSFKSEQVKETIWRVKEVLLRRKKEQVLDLPEKIFSIRDVALSSNQEKRYNEVCDDLLLRITTLSGEQYIRDIDNVLEQFLRAVQIASNPRLVDESWHGEPAKFLKIDTIIEEVVKENEQKIIVWTNYRKNVQELCDRYKAYGVRGFTGDVKQDERQRIVNSFQNKNDNSIKILVAIPAAGGVGLTLTAAQTAVYLERTWNAEHWLQSVDRIHRIGQTGTVNIICLHACKVDELIHWNLMRKSKNLKKLLDSKVQLETAVPPSKEELLAALKRV